MRVLRAPAYHLKRVGLEAGPLSQWLFGALAEANVPVICVETAAHACRAQRSDKKDRSQRCPRYRTDDASGALSASPCEDITQSEVANAVDASQAAAVEGHRHRE